MIRVSVSLSGGANGEDLLSSEEVSRMSVSETRSLLNKLKYRRSFMDLEVNLFDFNLRKNAKLHFSEYKLLAGQQKVRTID